MGNFWQDKALTDFTPEEWEKVCTRCGKCCLIKLEDEDSGMLCYTKLVCKYFDKANCACREYEKRCVLVPECLKLSPENLQNLTWMPFDCAYRILYEQGDLPDWHPLKTGKPLPEEKTIAPFCINEEEADGDWEDYVIEDAEL